MKLTTPTPTLAQLRAELAELGIALRADRDALALARATVEQHTIDTAGGSKALGPNEDERTRKLTLAIGSSDNVGHWLARVRDHEAQLDRLSAQLATLLDQRRAAEWAIRERTLQLLEASARYADEASDERLDERIEDQVLAKLALPF